MHVHQAGVGGVAVSPHLLEEDFTGEHLARLARQCDQQVEFEWCERDLLAAAADLVCRNVDHDVGDAQQLGRLLFRAAQASTHPRHQLLRLERLHDVVVRTGFEAEYDVDGVGLGRQHHDGHAGIRTQNSAYVDPVHSGKHEIEQDEVGPGLTHCRERQGSVAYHVGSKPSPRSTIVSISASAVSSSTTRILGFISLSLHLGAMNQTVTRPCGVPRLSLYCAGKFESRPQG